MGSDPPPLFSTKPKQTKSEYSPTHLVPLFFDKLPLLLSPLLVCPACPNQLDSQHRHIERQNCQTTENSTGAGYVHINTSKRPAKTTSNLLHSIPCPLSHCPSAHALFQRPQDRILKQESICFYCSLPCWISFLIFYLLLNVAFWKGVCGGGGDGGKLEWGGGVGGGYVTRKDDTTTILRELSAVGDHHSGAGLAAGRADGLDGLDDIHALGHLHRPTDRSHDRQPAVHRKKDRAGKAKQTIVMRVGHTGRTKRRWAGLRVATEPLSTPLAATFAIAAAATWLRSHPKKKVR